MDDKARAELAISFGAIALAAGKAIMAVRASGTEVRAKSDGSPVTRADLDADRLIHQRLAALLLDIPVVSEESTETHRLSVEDRFILVDPLDGTREFTGGRDEFTVNLALIEDGSPSVGAIYAPALDKLYIASPAGAFRAGVAPGATMPSMPSMQRLAAAPIPREHLRAVMSRSHLDPETEKWLEAHSIGDVAKVGSSLKFCVIAEGNADVYPRLAPTMEWDIAAGHAILVAAGGCVESPDGSALTYGKHELGYCNGSFVAWGARRTSERP